MAAFDIPINLVRDSSLVAAAADQSYEINPSSVIKSSTTIMADQSIFITTKVNPTQPQPEFACLNLKNPGNKPVKTIKFGGITRATATEGVESIIQAIINPSENIAVLQTGKLLRIYDIGAGALNRELKSYSFKEEIYLVKFISEHSLGIVTKSYVYHWKIICAAAGTESKAKGKEQQQPMKMLSRQTSSAGDLNLIGSSMQLHDIKKKSTKKLDGYVGCFTQFKYEGSSKLLNLLCYVSRAKDGSKSQLIVQQIADDNEVPRGAKHLPILNKEIHEYVESTICSTLEINSKEGIIYLIALPCHVYLFDLESGDFMQEVFFGGDVSFVATTLDESTGGVLCLNDGCEMISISLNKNTVVPYFASHGHTNLARRLARRCGIVEERRTGSSGSASAGISGENAHAQIPIVPSTTAAEAATAADCADPTQEFNFLFECEQYKEAAMVVIEAPNNILRTPKTLQMFQQAAPKNRTQSPLLQYFGVILDQGSLNKDESLCFVKLLLKYGKKDMIRKTLREEKIQCSEALGDLVYQTDVATAGSIYWRAEIHPKVITCFLDTNLLEQIIPYVKRVSYTPDYVAIVKELVKTSPDDAVRFSMMMIQNHVASNDDVNEIVDILIESNLGNHCSLLLDKLTNTSQPDPGASHAHASAEAEELSEPFSELAAVKAQVLTSSQLGSEELNCFPSAPPISECDEAEPDAGAAANQPQHNDNNDICVICLCARKTTLLNPCGHYSFCTECSEELADECPLCRRPIVSKLKVYET